MTENNEANENAVNASKYFYYEAEGKIVGPIIDSEFYGKVSSKEIHHESLIWTEGDTAWSRLGQLYKVDEPPPLPLAYLSDGYAVTLALMPFIQVAIIKYVDSNFRAEMLTLSEYSSFLYGVLFFLLFFIPANIILLADVFSLEKKGIKMGKLMLLVGNLIPTYLFYRATLIGRLAGAKWSISHILPFVWIVCANYIYHWRLF